MDVIDSALPYEKLVEVASREPTARELGITNSGVVLFERPAKADDIVEILAWIFRATALADDLFHEQFELEMWSRRIDVSAEDAVLHELAARRLHHRVRRLELLIAALDARLKGKLK